MPQGPDRQLGPTTDGARQRTGDRRAAGIRHRRNARFECLNITKYADELLDVTLHELPAGPDRVPSDSGKLDRQERGRYTSPSRTTSKDATGKAIQDGRMCINAADRDTIMAEIHPDRHWRPAALRSCAS